MPGTDDKEYIQEGINMQLKPIKDKIEVLEKHKHPEIIGKKEIYNEPEKDVLFGTFSIIIDQNELDQLKNLKVKD